MSQWSDGIVVSQAANEAKAIAEVVTRRPAL